MCSTSTCRSRHLPLQKRGEGIIRSTVHVDFDFSSFAATVGKPWPSQDNFENMRYTIEINIDRRGGRKILFFASRSPATKMFAACDRLTTTDPANRKPSDDALLSHVWLAGFVLCAVKLQLGKTESLADPGLLRPTYRVPGRAARNRGRWLAPLIHPFVQPSASSLTPLPRCLGRQPSILAV